MNIKKMIPALLAASMLSGILPAASAADTPVVEYAAFGGSAELVITGLPSDRQVHSVQLELTLNGLHSLKGEENNAVTYTADPQDEKAHTALREVQHNPDGASDGTTSLTLYLDSILRLDRDREVTMGILELPDEEAEITFSPTGKLTLLDERQRVILTQKEIEIPVRKASEGSITPGGSTGNGTSTPSGSTSSGGASHDIAGNRGSGQSDTYRTNVSTTGKGEVRVSPSSAKKGDTVTVTAVPDEGCEVAEIAVFDSRGRELDLREKSDNVYTFTMPDSEVSIEVSFTLAAAAGSNEQQTPMALPFTDVAASEWYHSAVQFVYQNGMMSGTSSTAFSPNMPTSRAMIVSILHRLEGAPAAGGSTFPDVAAGQYYTAAVSWAAENGIVSGYSNGQFRPNDSITREQLAAILYRYAQYKSYPTAATAELSSFPDAASVSAYAVEPVRWAVSQGLISGTSRGTLDPAGGAVRAQAASILMRFCQSFT